MSASQNASSRLLQKLKAPRRRSGERQRQQAGRFHAIRAQDLHDHGKAALAVDAHHERLLGLPDDTGRRLRGRQVDHLGEAGSCADEGVEPHDVAHRVVQHHGEAIEVGDAPEHVDELAEQTRQIPVRGDGTRDVEERSVKIRVRSGTVARGRARESHRGVCRPELVVHAVEVYLHSPTGKVTPPGACRGVSRPTVVTDGVSSSKSRSRSPARTRIGADVLQLEPERPCGRHTVVESPVALVESEWPRRPRANGLLVGLRADEHLAADEVAVELRSRTSDSSQRLGDAAARRPSVITAERSRIMIEKPPALPCA